MFRDRAEAGERLAEAVARAAPRDPVVLALPRGGVPLGRAVAARLGAPLDLVFVRKIGVPGQPEIAAGALVDEIEVFNEDVLRAEGLDRAEFRDQIDRLRAENAARRGRYGCAPLPVAGRTAILVDDGIATGASIRAALRATRAAGARAVWIAVPVGPAETVAELGRMADRVICLEQPLPFRAVGLHYRDFGQVSDAEVIDLLRDRPV
ncbi:MAG TPA: phosphoribosyltransferase [Rhodobacteraceae bacterium]|nr:phosphoribosyltransferase [Paracoccaceae bacterium]